MCCTINNCTRHLLPGLNCFFSSLPISTKSGASCTTWFIRVKERNMKYSDTEVLFIVQATRFTLLWWTEINNTHQADFSLRVTFTPMSTKCLQYIFVATYGFRHSTTSIQRTLIKVSTTKKAKSWSFDWAQRTTLAKLGRMQIKWKS